MELLEFPEGDTIPEIDLAAFFDDSPDDLSLLGADAFNTSSPDWERLSIDEIRNELMKDREDGFALEVGKEVSDSFFASLLVDSPSGGSGEVVDGLIERDSGSSNPRSAGDGHDKQSVAVEVVNDGKNADDPIFKKRQRQLRNRDAAVRSRERKKIYVKDLEMKSNYLERECLRLGRLFQCLAAENQALRLSLQNSNAHGAPMAKQESAVLLMESLLLGSLFWFLGIMCLTTLPVQLQLALETGNAGKRDPAIQAPKGARNETDGSHRSVTFFTKGRRCKASKTKMRAELLIPDAPIQFLVSSSITPSRSPYMGSPMSPLSL